MRTGTLTETTLQMAAELLPPALAASLDFSVTVTSAQAAPVGPLDETCDLSLGKLAGLVEKHRANPKTYVHPDEPMRAFPPSSASSALATFMFLCYLAHARVCSGDFYRG